MRSQGLYTHVSVDSRSQTPAPASQNNAVAIHTSQRATLNWNLELETEKKFWRKDQEWNLARVGNRNSENLEKAAEAAPGLARAALVMTHILLTVVAKQ